MDGSLEAGTCLACLKRLIYLKLQVYLSVLLWGALLTQYFYNYLVHVQVHPILLSFICIYLNNIATADPNTRCFICIF